MNVGSGISTLALGPSSLRSRPNLSSYGGRAVAMDEGGHPQRELTPMPRLGFPCPRLGMAAGAWRVLRLLALISLGTAGPLLAHHSFAMFDHTRTLTLKGTVTKFQWTNPHAYIELDVPAPGGATTHFTIECTSINMMQRLGWRSNMIKAGDQVKATVAPLLTGQPGGLLLDIILPDGRKMEPGVPGINTFKRTPETE
jgi:hypothetical protein